MKIFSFVDGNLSNFGDHLNEWMWSQILSTPLDVEDGILVLGIGTVISRALIPPAKQYIVMSSGVGYNAAPAGFGGPAWKILAVRGPLSALVLNLPPEKAVTDGAALLALLPECAPLPESERSGIVFMPHYASLPSGNWKEVCDLAGIEFLDPHADSRQTVQRIRTAKLVIADAMHAAIVADTMRVPWIPVVLSPESNTFKWLDWTLTLDLPYRPTHLPASTLYEAVRRKTSLICGEKDFVSNPTAANVVKHYLQKKKIKSWKLFPWYRWRMVQLTRSLPKRIISRPIFEKIAQRKNASMTRLAVKHLQRVAGMPSYLSGEKIFHSRLDQLASLLPKVKA